MDTPDPTSLFEFLRPGGILPALLVLALTYVAASFVARLLGNLGERFADRRLVLQQTKAVLRLVVFFVGILIAASFLFSFSSEALLALGGTIAVAMGFAFKDLLASMIAGARHNPSIPHTHSCPPSASLRGSRRSARASSYRARLWLGFLLRSRRSRTR